MGVIKNILCFFGLHQHRGNWIIDSPFKFEALYEYGNCHKFIKIKNHYGDKRNETRL